MRLKSRDISQFSSFPQKIPRYGRGSNDLQMTFSETLHDISIYHKDQVISQKDAFSETH